MASAEPPEWKTLMLSGMIAAGRNPRILLSYWCGVHRPCRRFDQGHVYFAMGHQWRLPGGQYSMTTAEALARGGQLIGILSLVGHALGCRLFGWILDRVNRVTGLAIAMGLAGVGYSSMWLGDFPAGFRHVAVHSSILSIGQVSAICASVTLVGQEATPAERGAVISMNGFFGAIGIFLAFFLGGRLFDAYGPAAPFVMVGLVQLVLAAAAVLVRLAAPSGRAAESV